MKEVVLDIVNCCENRISVVEELITGAYYATATLDASLAEAAEERAKLKISLQEILARNCSLRRKDFNTLMQIIVSESEMKKSRLEEERKYIRQALTEYIDEQKQLVSSLRQQLVDFVHRQGDKDALEETINKIKTAYQRKGLQVFAQLRDFHVRLEVCWKEEREINGKLRSLVSRGESLRLEDLRQFPTVRIHQEREVVRRLRRPEVGRLVAHS
ncbi:MAG: hypothetical protein HY667_03315 [Chloroflexi bacterium]|nr:hypothetical protein [Chloroflexota bacterium]